MKQSEFTEWLFDELKQVLVDTSDTGITSVSEASDNVDIANGDVDHPYPFIGVQTISTNPQAAGIGTGQLRVVDEVYDTNGVLQEVTRQRESTTRMNLIPVTDGNPHLRDELSDAIVDHFTLLESKGNYPDDITFEQIGESSPEGRPEEFVRSTATTLVVSRERNLVDSNPVVAEEINVDVDVGDETSDDAFDETF
jgi:hypothetical protein